MEHRTLGKTGLKVSVLGFGGAEIGFEGASPVDVDRIVGAAIDAGVNVIDTAECYDDSEEKLGVALASRRQSVFVFTKCGHASGFDAPDWDPKMLAQSIDRSLARLQTSYVDLIQLHSCSAELLREGAVVEVLRRAREAGKARFIGYSGDGEDAEYAVGSGVFDTLQTSINVADQQVIERVLPLVGDAGMGVIAKRPIANAAWKYDNPGASEYHYEYWKRLGVLDYAFTKKPLAAAVSTALRFTLALPGVTMAIVGTKSPERFMANLRILNDGPLPPEEFIGIRERWATAVDPAWVPQT